MKISDKIYEDFRNEAERLVLTRFTTFEDLKKKLMNKFNYRQFMINNNIDLSFRNYDFKSDYDNDFEDYSVIIEVFSNGELAIDLQLYYAITRIGERIIVEINCERV